VPGIARLFPTGNTPKKGDLEQKSAGSAIDRKTVKKSFFLVFQAR
jgi:hypothetical protein